MGIKLLNSFIKKKCNETLQKKHLHELSGKKIVVDASIYIYKFLENDLLIENMYILCSIFRYYDIIPLFVFDGKPPSEKKATINERKIKKKIAKQNYSRLALEYKNSKQPNIMKKMKELKKKIISVKKDDIKQIKMLFDCCGVQWFQAKEEADSVCAHLVKTGIAYACLSEDTDLFLYGCPRVLRYLSLINHTVILYDLYKIIHKLQLSFNDFKKICILSGTDYNKSTKNIYTYHNLFKLFRLSKETDFYKWLIYKNLLETDILLLNKISNIYIQTLQINNLTNISYNEIQKNELITLLHSKNFILI